MTTRTRSRVSVSDLGNAPPTLTVLYPKKLKTGEVPRVVAIEHPDGRQDHHKLPAPPSPDLHWWCCGQFCSTHGRRVYYLAKAKSVHAGCLANPANNALIPSASLAAAQLATAANMLSSNLDAASANLRKSLTNGAGGSAPLPSRPVRSRDVDKASLNVHHLPPAQPTRLGDDNHSHDGEEPAPIAPARLFAAPLAQQARKPPRITYQRTGIPTTLAGTSVRGDVVASPGLRATPTTFVESTPVPTARGGSSVSSNGQPAMRQAVPLSSHSESECEDSLASLGSAVRTGAPDTPSSAHNDAHTKALKKSGKQTNKPDVETPDKDKDKDKDEEQREQAAKAAKERRKADRAARRLEKAARKAAKEQKKAAKQTNAASELEEATGDHKAARKAERAGRKEKAANKRTAGRQEAGSPPATDEAHRRGDAAMEVDEPAIGPRTSHPPTRAAKSARGLSPAAATHASRTGEAEDDFDLGVDEGLDISPDLELDLELGLLDWSPPARAPERSGKQNFASNPHRMAPVQKRRVADGDDESLAESVQPVSKKQKTNRPASPTRSFASAIDKRAQPRSQKKQAIRSPSPAPSHTPADDSVGDFDDDLPQLVFTAPQERALKQALSKSKNLYDPRDIYVNGKIVLPQQIAKDLAPGQTVTFRREKAGAYRPYFTIDGIHMHGPTGEDLGAIRYYRVAQKHLRSSERNLKDNTRKSMERIITNLSKLEEQTGAEAFLFVKPQNDHAQIYGTSTFREGIEGFGTQLWKWGTDQLASVTDGTRTEELAVQAEASGSKRTADRARKELQRRNEQSVATAKRKSHGARDSLSDDSDVDGEKR